MRLAIQFDSDREDNEVGQELVIFREQMFRDVYYHEQDPRPSFEDFISKPLTRPNDEFFWVYRQGTFIDSHYLWNENLYVGYASTMDLDASPVPTFEGYHHIKSLSLDGCGRIAIGTNTRYTLQQQIQHLEHLYKTSMYEDV